MIKPGWIHLVMTAMLAFTTFSGETISRKVKKRLSELKKEIKVYGHESTNSGTDKCLEAVTEKISNSREENGQNVRNVGTSVRSDSQPIPGRLGFKDTPGAHNYSSPNSR